jgi:hypothetical protein
MEWHNVVGVASWYSSTVAVAEAHDGSCGPSKIQGLQLAPAGLGVLIKMTHCRGIHRAAISPPVSSAIQAETIPRTASGQSCRAVTDSDNGNV